MGRKNKQTDDNYNKDINNKKNKKDKDNIEDCDIENKQDEIIYNIEEEKEEEDRKLSIMCDMRRILIEYCYETSIPLCEYLSIENMIEYIESLV